MLWEIWTLNLLYALHSRKETQTEHSIWLKMIEFFINTLYISHCRVFNHMQQDFHMHSQFMYVKNLQWSNF